MNNTIKKVEKNIKKYGLIKKENKILLGLSGGPDSVMLFHVLRLLKNEFGFDLFAAHINHLYRGEDAFNDEEFVKDLCNKYDIELFIKRKNSAELAKKNRITEEEAGREIRYNFFYEILEKVGEGFIATAHNKNDQGETLLQRIIRGSGIEGLAGINFKQENIIRPILNIERKEIIDFLNNNKYTYCVDKTNDLPIYGRNKIRLELVPYIEKNFNKNINNTLYRLSENMKDDYLIIKEAIEEKFKDALIIKNDKKIELEIESLKNNSKGVRSRVLRNSIEFIKGNKIDVERKHIDYLDDFMIKNETGKFIDLGDNIIAEISYGSLIIKIKDKIKNYEYNLNNGLNYIKEINKSIKIVQNGNNTISSKKQIITIDKERIKGKLIIRNRRDGDKFQPLGMKGTKKLKDYFIDEKIPKLKREQIPIICDEENIIWIVEYRMNHKYRLTKDTKKTTTIEIMEV